MYDKVLIANRGEISVRISRALKELGVTSVAIYQPNDDESYHIDAADEAINLEDNRGYLKQELVIEKAEQAGADAIHPGYGFMSENADFIRKVEDSSLDFIGPSADSVDAMGVKTEARTTMKEAGVPIMPGTTEPTNDPEEVKQVAEDIGYPVMVKASGGGGGMGIRVVHNEDEVEDAVESAQKQAKRAFGMPDLYVEKFLEEPRHIEIQVIADEHGNTIHLGERDCSIQRRRQKVVEEGPSPALTPELREEMGQMAVEAAEAVDYVNAGTVECMLDKDGENYYFLEMNTRIQVEHPVTEMLTGVDLVKEQVRVAAGEVLKHSQEDIELEGAAIECRLNAEDPSKNFKPGPGLIEGLNIPNGPFTRCDTFVFDDYKVPATFDSMIGKLIVWGEDRDEAIQRMKRALDELEIGGIPTTADVQRKLLRDEAFTDADYHVQFFEDWVEEQEFKEPVTA
ncbi:MAG: acetyl/propionyl/methylcrotonyl-CoA carboxylase subunit alpha [bacterium]